MATMSSMRRVEEIKLDVPWGYVAGKAWGCTQDTRVLVVHGHLDNAGSFDRLISMLPDPFYYVAIDLPGHGFSSPLPPGIHLHFFEYVFTIKLVLEALKWDNCFYIGHSFGAQLGVFYSIVFPGKINRMVCLDGFIPNPVAPNELSIMIQQFEESTRRVIEKTAPLYTKNEILHALISKRNFPLNSEAAKALFVRATTRVGELYKYNRDLRLRSHVPLPFFDIAQLMELAKGLKIPVLIILAEFSWFSNELYTQSLEKVASSMRSTNCTVIRVAGNHDVHNNNPETVAPHVRAFLCGVEKSKL